MVAGVGRCALAKLAMVKSGSLPVSSMALMLEHTEKVIKLLRVKSLKATT